MKKTSGRSVQSKWNADRAFRSWRRIMVLDRRVKVLSLFFILALMASASFAQRPGDGSPGQRLEVMRQKLETIRRSATSAASVLKQESDDDKKDEKENLDTPLSRLRSIEKEASSLQSEVNSIRSKVDRSEKYDATEIDRLEAEVTDLQRRSDAVQTETAQA